MNGLVIKKVCIQPDSQVADGLYWLDQVGTNNRLGIEFSCTSTEGAPHYLSFAGIQFETIAEHPFAIVFVTKRDNGQGWG